MLLDIAIPGGLLLLILFGVLLVIIWSFTRVSSLKEKNYELSKTNITQESAIKEYQLKFQQKESEFRLQANQWALGELEKYKTTELEAAKKVIENNALESATNLLVRWKVENEETIRKDAIARSNSINLGKITEHLLPFHLKFPYNPKDARFIGSPIDLIVFDGAADKKPLVDVVFIEVKTGNSQLNEIQKKIKYSVLNNRIKWLEINPADL